ncbi:MAG: aminotransferase class IV [Rickettsiales bacterium]|nr:aminotransferase class IV [Rickettsiales bacterium]
MSIVYVKGAFVQEAQAHISIAERGFRYGDGLFESIYIQAGQARHLNRHLKRLANGLQALRISAPKEELETLVQQLIVHNKTIEGVLRLSVSRGIGSAGYLPTTQDPPTVVAEITPLPEFSEDPLKLWLSNWRKPSRRSLPVEAKLSQGVNSTLARMEAHEHGCDEALMLNPQEAICEASSANIFWRLGGLIYTPADSCGLLKGIAREILLEEWQVQKAAFDLETLQGANSVMICNSIRGAMPILSLDPQGWQWFDSSLADEAQAILDATP